MSTSRGKNASTHLVTFHHGLSDLQSGEALPATIHTHMIWLQLCKSSKLWVVRAFLLCWFHSGRDCLSCRLPREAPSSLWHLLFQKLRQYFSPGLWNLVLVSDFLGRQCPSFSDSAYTRSCLILQVKLAFLLSTCLSIWLLCISLMRYSY